MPAVGNVEAYLALDVGTLNGAADEPPRMGVLVCPRKVSDRRLTTAVRARWCGWCDMLGVHRRGLVDDESVLEEFNALACDVWGKPSRTEVVPAFSPLGADARRGAVNISQLLAERERAVLDPDR